MHLIIEILSTTVKITAYENDDYKHFLSHLDIATEIEMEELYEYSFTSTSIKMPPNPISKSVIKNLCKRISKQCGRTKEELNTMLESLQY